MLFLGFEGDVDLKDLINLKNVGAAEKFDGEGLGIATRSDSIARNFTDRERSRAFDEFDDVAGEGGFCRGAVEVEGSKAQISDAFRRSGVEIQLAIAGGDAEVDVFDLVAGNAAFGDG